MSRRATAIWILIGLAAGVAAAACRKERVPPPADAGPPRPSPSAFCNDVWQRAQKELAAALPSARPCKENADCEVVDMVACLWGCGSEAIPKTDVPAIAAKRNELKATTCKTWEDADCLHITPIAVPSCAVPGAVCRDGACTIQR